MCLKIRKKRAKKQSRLEYSRYTENLIEIVTVFVNLAGGHPELTDIDSVTWEQEFVGWANEFEDMHPDFHYWDDNDYPESIEQFAIEKILKYAGLEE